MVRRSPSILQDNGLHYRGREWSTWHIMRELDTELRFPEESDWGYFWGANILEYMRRFWELHLPPVPLSALPYSPGEIKAVIDSPAKSVQRRILLIGYPPVREPPLSGFEVH